MSLVFVEFYFIFDVVNEKRFGGGLMFGEEDD